MSITDTGRLHDAERNLAQRMRRLEAVFTRATIGIIVATRQGHVVLANEKSHQLFGYAGGALVGTAPESLIRTLSEFKQSGLIELTGHGIRVLQPEKLRQPSW